MEEIEALFVVAAPNPDAREELFAAMQLHFRLVRRLLPAAEYWVDGGFVTHKLEPPKDIDVAIVVGNSFINALPPQDISTLTSLLTLQDGQGRNGGLQVTGNRIQPIGGLVDGFLVPSDDAAYVQAWHDNWQSVSDPVTKMLLSGEQKGYLEVVT